MLGIKTWKFKRGYVSEIDQYLQELYSKYGEKSTSCLNEIQKYKKVFMLRDRLDAMPEIEQTWKDF